MIALFGLNHKTAPIEIREKFVFCEEDIKRFAPIIKTTGINGIVIVSTCNRTEFYFETTGNDTAPIFDILEKTLFEYRKIQNYKGEHFYRKEHDDAARHLFRVTSGLDSMALGEYQIVGQMKDAFNFSKKYNICSPVLVRLFNKAFESSKKVRTNTKLNRGAVSVSYAAVEMTGKKLGCLSEHPILLVGAGETGELTIQSLIKKGCKNFTVTNRTFEKAQGLAKKYNGKAEDFSNLGDLLVNNNIVITSTASKKPLITVGIVKEAMKKRNDTPLVLVDLSVPRNVAMEVGEIENVSVYDIDELKGVIEGNFEKRKGEISHAEEIIDEIVTDFVNWHCSRTLSSTFQSISNSLKEVHKSELQGFKKKQFDSDVEKASEFGNLITSKLTRLMIRNVKSITDNGRKEEYVKMVNKLFELG
ncbi:Glutamyl-tRNA reductase [hydrothermal vent metagenome]|uniref:glutamyl-tRNA reductase n=1 Tax=hydrothermal vent metagenome TaxID=652676 RepID=A0A3B0U5J0_9ZZZZ